jgi:hypothetical protein
MKIFDCCSATQFAVAALFLFFIVGAKAETMNDLSDAEIQGRALAQQLCDSQPEDSFTNTGVLQIRDDNGNRTNVPVKCETIVTATNWFSIYEAEWTNRIERLLVLHAADRPNGYFYDTNFDRIPLLGNIPILGHLFRSHHLSGAEAMTSFAGSDFWLCDLGLEFLHWPEQKILPNPTNLKRGRSYALLESTNPDPSTNGYSRVLSWIDKETGGILEAEAYDARGKLLKVFEPKSFKKVDGQWQLQEMQIENVQTGSRTRLEFDLKK